MSILLTFLISVLGVAAGKFIFHYWINHLTIYSFIWGGLIILYELKLLPYVEVIPFTWFCIASAFFSFLFGILTVISMKNLFAEKENSSISRQLNLSIFADGGKTVKFVLVISSIIGLLSGIQHWMVLIDMFGSIPMVFLNARTVYELSLEGEIRGVIPYISNFGYVAVFFSGIYTAYKGKFSFYTFLPFIGVIIQQLAIVGRAGMLFAFLEFFFSFFALRQLLVLDSLERFKFSKRNAFVAVSILMLLLIISASIVRITRGSKEDFSGTSKELQEFEDSFFISPSIYLYLSSDVGVLNQYLKSDGETTKFGENTFLLFHDFLAKFDIIKRPSDFQKGYYIPMWTNTGTYIRELHADFGVVGVFLVPYLLGIVITWLWYRFHMSHSLIVLSFLTYFNLIVGFSFLVMITRLSGWFISLFLIIVSIPMIERIALFLGRRSPQ